MHKPLNIYKESKAIGTVALVMWLNSAHWSKSSVARAPLGKVLKEEGACSALSFLCLVENRWKPCSEDSRQETEGSPGNWALYENFLQP